MKQEISTRRLVEAPPRADRQGGENVTKNFRVSHFHIPGHKLKSGEGYRTSVVLRHLASPYHTQPAVVGSYDGGL
jgi:hypothetical protein